MNAASHIKAKKKRGKTRFPGVGADAAALGVNRRTLQRVLAGEWTSKRLSARYVTLKQYTAPSGSQKIKGQPVKKPRFQVPDFSAPSAVPLHPNWKDRVIVLKPLGFTEVVCEVRFTKEILIFAGPNFETVLGEELETAELGRFEEIQRGQPFHLFFHLDTKKLPAALEFLRARLDRLKILPLCRIAFADCDMMAWQQFYPAPAAPGSEAAP